MKQKVLSLSLAAMLIGGVSVQAAATPTSQVSENKAKYKELSDQIMTLNSQVSTLNSQIENLNKVTNENDLKMKDIENQIAATKSRISTVQEEINKKQAAFGVRISAMYKSQYDFNPVVFLLSSNNFGDFLSRLNAFSRIMNLDNDMIDSLLTSKKSLESDMTSLDQNEQALKTLQESTQNSLQELSQKKQEQETSINELNKQKTSVLSTIEENENELISYSVNIINSKTSSLEQLENAKSTLVGLLPQLSVDSVENTANQAINTANNAIKSLQQKQAQLEQEKANQEKAQQEKQASSNNASGNGHANANNSNNSNTESKKPDNSNTTNNSNTNNNSNSNNSANGSSNTSNPTTDYKQVLHVQATAYSGGTITAMGLKPVRDPNGISTIAVDPSVIPLGSKVYIPGYGYAIAADTGGAIKGNKIDLFLNSEQACLSWGIRPVTVYIVAYPGQW
ncbi:MAG: 3D domain-containing protein [Sarcina sp.]